MTPEEEALVGPPTAWLAHDARGPALFLDKPHAVDYAARRRTDLQALYAESVIRLLLADRAKLVQQLEELAARLDVSERSIVKVGLL